MSEKIIGIVFVVFIIAIVVGVSILCVKSEKKAVQIALEEQKRKRLEYKERFLNNPTFHVIMDDCVKCHIQSLLSCVSRRDSSERISIEVHYGALTLHNLREPHNRLTFREYDMENFENLDMLLSFIDASKVCLKEKILNELRKYDINNCKCNITRSEYETIYYIRDELKKTMHYYISIECVFSYHLNAW